MAGAVLVEVWPNLVSLNVNVQVMNAFMLPLVVAFLIALAVRALPQAHRLRRAYLWFVVIISVLTCAHGPFGSLSSAGLLR